jgi:transcriptional regulator with XRE-family HTH domain
MLLAPAHFLLGIQPTMRNNAVVKKRARTRVLAKCPARNAVDDLSTKPFGEALRALMDERGLSYRGLAEAIRRFDPQGITHAHINMLANGHDKPSLRAMELIARACSVSPDYFAEYRLAVAMRELDPTVVGLEQALDNLNARLAARRKRTDATGPARRSRPARPRPTG